MSQAPPSHGLVLDEFMWVVGAERKIWCLSPSLNPVGKAARWKARGCVHREPRGLRAQQLSLGLVSGVLGNV